MLPWLPFLWSYGVFCCSISLRVITVFRDVIYVIIIPYSWHFVICEHFWPYVWNNWSWVIHPMSTWFWHKNRVWHAHNIHFSDSALDISISEFICAKSLVLFWNTRYTYLQLENTYKQIGFGNTIVWNSECGMIHLQLENTSKQSLHQMLCSFHHVVHEQTRISQSIMKQAFHNYFQELQKILGEIAHAIITQTTKPSSICWPKLYMAGN
jgi:hypothetical protein